MDTKVFFSISRNTKLKYISRNIANAFLRNYSYKNAAKYKNIRRLKFSVRGFPAEVGKVTLKINGDEALSDESV